ncbi:MAG: transketolase [Chlamydiales bacterium]|jgi:transketolase
MKEERIKELDQICRQVRYKTIEMSHLAKTPHLGSSLSCIDILVALYWRVLQIDPKKPNSPERDRLILSKGHAALALYVTLCERGFFSEEILATYNKPGSSLAEHPGPYCVPGIEAATGSLGHGLSIGVGKAMAAKILNRKTKVFVVMSDGECNEGSSWEAAMMAPAHNLDNITAIVDYNKWQATGRSNATLALDPLKDKWEAFGWSTREVDGHSIEEILKAVNPHAIEKGKPTAIIAHTIKGKGVSFMEDDNNWHYRIPNEDEIIAARKELGLV